MKNKNIPAIIALLASLIASVTCIINRYSLLETLSIVLLVLLVFYIIGIIVGKNINRINKAANDAYTEEERKKMNTKEESADLADHEQQPDMMQE